MRLLRLTVILLFYLRRSNAQLNCSFAPEIGRRIMCFQIQKWDEDVRALSPLSLAVTKTSEEKPTIYDCMTMECVCSFMSGNCPTKKSVRKEYRMMTDDERNKFNAALWKIKRNGEFLPLSRIHAQARLSPGAHSGPAFFPWHREYIKRIEIAIRNADPTVVGIPYWDSTLDRYLPNPIDSVFWSDELMGKNDPDTGSLKSGAFADWMIDDGTRVVRRDLGDMSSLVTEDDLTDIYQLKTVTQFLAYSAPKKGCPEPASWDAPEFVHGKPHVWTGGDMLLTRMSTHDPLFFLHHSFVDLMWETWREMRQTREIRETEYPKDNPACSTPSHFAKQQMTPFNKMNIDGLSNQYFDNLISYEQRPSCTTGKPDCGSKYLFCDLSHGPARCLSKVRLGGKCRGFTNGEAVCYGGICNGGTCVSDKPVSRVVVSFQGTYNKFKTRPTTRKPPPKTTTRRPYTRRTRSTTRRRPRPPPRKTPKRPRFIRNRRVKSESFSDESGSTSEEDVDTTPPSYETTTSAYESPDEPKTSYPSREVCYNEHYCCRWWAKKGECPLNPNFMYSKCKASCEICQPSYDIKVECGDYSRSCDNLVMLIGCGTDWMAENCRKSCDLCDVSREDQCSKDQIIQPTYATKPPYSSSKQPTTIVEPITPPPYSSENIKYSTKGYETETSSLAYQPPESVSSSKATPGNSYNTDGTTTASVYKQETEPSKTTSNPNTSQTTEFATTKAEYKIRPTYPIKVITPIYFPENSTYPAVTKERTTADYPDPSTPSSHEVYTSPIPQPTSQSSYPAPTCLNHHFCCIGWAKLGHCQDPEFTAFMGEYCAPSCDRCGYTKPHPLWKSSEVCEDFLPNCEALAARGDCIIHSVYMKENCRKTCRSCEILNFKIRLAECGLDRGPLYDEYYMNRQPAM